MPLHVTIFPALAVYSRSPAAYEALKSFKLVQLPCFRTLKYYIDANLESAGDCTPRIKLSRHQYKEMIDQVKKSDPGMCTNYKTHTRNDCN